MTFFRPESVFLHWLKEYVGARPVFDVGCGECEFLQRMWDVGIKAMGIDKYAMNYIDVPMKVLMRVLGMDATQCKVLQEHAGVVLFCRPNHTGWVADTIQLLHPDSEVLYISKPGNRHVDLPEYTTEVIEAPGCDLEVVYKVLKPYPKFAEPNYYLAGVERTLAMMDGWPGIGGSE